MSIPGAVLAATAVTSSILQGQAQTAQLEAQQAALEDEKKYLDQQRAFLDEARDEELDLFQKDTAELLGVQEVSFAKAGVEMSGSALRVLRETAQEAQEEEGRIINQYAHYKTMNEMKRDAANRQISNIGTQKSGIPLLTGISAISGAATGYYTGKKLT